MDAMPVPTLPLCRTCRSASSSLALASETLAAQLGAGEAEASCPSGARAVRRGGRSWLAPRAPLGPVGKAIDAAIGHRIAEASVHHFLDDIVAQIGRDLREGT